MPATEAFRHKHLNATPDEFVCGVTKYFFRLPIHQNNFALLVDGHNGIGSRLDDLLKSLRRPMSLRRGGCNDQSCQSQYRQEQVQQQERVVFHLRSKWPKPVDGAPNRDTGKKESGQGRLALAKAKGRPNDQGDAQEFQRMICASRSEKSAKCKTADREKKR